MSTVLADRLDSRRKAFKKGVDAEDQRRKREDEAVSLRKAKRDDMMQKKRQLIDPTPAADGENAPPSNVQQSKPGKTDSMQQMAARLALPISPEERHQITFDLRKKLSQAHNPPTQEAVDAGLIVPMVQYIAQQEDTKLQFEALWVLTNIASGESHLTEAVVHSGAVPHLVQLLASPLTETKEQAVWALANIVGDTPQARDFVLQHNPIPAMLQIIVEAEQSGALGMLRNATWALGNTCRGKPGPPMEIVGPAIPYLALLVQHADADVVGDTIWAFSYLSDGDTARIDVVLQSGVLPSIVQRLADSDERVAQPALRTVGNIASGTDAQTQAVVAAGALQQLPGLLQHRKKTIRKEALWTLSNVTAGTKEQIQAAIDAGLMGECVSLGHSGDWNVRKEALWCIANVIVGGAAEQVEYVHQVGATKLLTEALDQNNDHATTVAVLDAMKKLLQLGKDLEGHGLENPYALAVEEADGCVKLEALQEDANQDVYERAVEILTTYFGGEDEDGEDDGPALVTGGFNFA